MSNPVKSAKTLEDLFLRELEDMYDAEHRLLKALPKLARAATNDELKEAFLSHLKETEGQVAKLVHVFRMFGEKPKGKTCEAMVGLLKEGEAIAEQFGGTRAINAALIAAAQKVEHYETASYGCLTEWAEMLGNERAAAVLRVILNEEKAANDKLNDLARLHDNEDALGDSIEVEEPMEEAGTWRPRREASGS
jgi:ferritin-like metal-binding protein YciE